MKEVLLLTKEKGIMSERKQCGICLDTEHPTDMCLFLQEYVVVVKVFRGYQQKTLISKMIKSGTVIFNKENNFITLLDFSSILVFRIYS